MRSGHRTSDSRKPWLWSAVRLVLLMALLLPIILALAVFGGLGIVTLILGG